MGDGKDPSPTALRSPLSPTERDRNQKSQPSPRGRGGTARRRGPHVLHVVGVRGSFVGDISIALEVRYVRDFDGALPAHHLGRQFSPNMSYAVLFGGLTRSGPRFSRDSARGGAAIDVGNHPHGKSI